MRACGSPNEEDPWVSEPLIGTGECKPMKKKSQKNCRNVFNVSNDMKTIRKMFCKCILFFS
ncbi:hypothetical protein YC2023_086881 [Brassica napus]